MITVKRKHSVTVSENKHECKKDLHAQVIPITDQIRRLQTIIRLGFQKKFRQLNAVPLAR